MSETYRDKMRRKAARLAEISAELDSLHAQAAGLLGGPHDPHEGVILGQLGEARQALAGYLPTVRAEIAEAEAVGSYGAAYVASVYGGHGAREGGDR